MFVWRSTYNKLDDKYKKLCIENNKLKVKLIKAIRNDARDSKGRFTKA